jgi:hypothetical protein
MKMTDAGRIFYDSIAQYSNLEELINSGETEGLYLECKAPALPQITRDMRSNLARALSGFSNTAGGVILWGVSTTKHEHSGLDVLTQIEPIGNCKLFARHIENVASTLTSPSLTNIESKIITKNKGDTRGVVVTYIPKTLGDPVQSNIDNTFYFRSGDDFAIAPYEMVKRLFAATEIPDLHLEFNKMLVKVDEKGMWVIPIILSNESSAIAENVKVMVDVKNPIDCDEIRVMNFRDSSEANPGKKIYINDVPGVIHRGLNTLVGNISVKMKVEKRAKRLLKLEISIFANKMRAHVINTTLQLAKKGFSIILLKQRDLY